MTPPSKKTVFEEERPGFVRYVRSLLSNRADIDAEDVVQDVLVSVLERQDLPAAELIAGYVFRALKNRIIDMSRTQKRMVSLDSEMESGERLIDLLRETQPVALKQMQSAEAKTMLFVGLDSLSEIERYIIIAHQLEGVSFKELTTALDIPQNTLLSHKARGMKKLRKYFLTRNISVKLKENS